MLTETIPAPCREITPGQYQLIAHHLPRPRGNVKITNLQILDALMYVSRHDCSWSMLPASFGPWEMIYERVKRWSQNGVLDRVFMGLQRAQIMHIRIEDILPDDAVHADDAGPAAYEIPAFIWLPQMTELP